jgi:hypothetical protein
MILGFIFRATKVVKVYVLAQKEKKKKSMNFHLHLSFFLLPILLSILCKVDFANRTIYKMIPKLS